MSILPRLAVGSIQTDVDIQPIVWGLLSALEQDGLRTQSFLSRACFRPHDVAGAVSGNTARHLDSWLMTPEACRQLFLRATSTADLAIVEGKYDQALDKSVSRGTQSPLNAEVSGGSLDSLCDWLDLPRIAVVDVAMVNHCCVPRRPAADRILLDRIDSEADFFHWQTLLESLWGIPVVGGLGKCSQLRGEIAALPSNRKPPAQWCQALAQAFRKFSSVDRIIQLSSRGGVPVDWDFGQHHFAAPLPHSKVRVAVAFDDAFHCYFPDTLDMLELHGAKVRVFSPLRDECLPPETDIIYLGCGSPQEHAAALAENHCMLMALKEHVCSGRRIYAEGGGLAYLCQHIETADGKRTPMVGALRATARRGAVRLPPEPVEVSLAVDSWLGSAGTKLRGYRNRNWQLEPTGCMTRFASGADHQFDLVGRHQAIGSLVHLNFAAQPNLLGGFLRPCPEALAWAAK